MDRGIIWLGIVGLFALLGIFPAYANKCEESGLLQNKTQLAELLIDSAVEISCFKKSLNVLKSPEQALTLSRFEKNGRAHILAVLEDDGQTLTGIDLSEEWNRFDRDPFSLIQGRSFDEVVQAIRNASRNTTVRYVDLLPSVEGDRHIAIGINYAEHGKETGQVHPFLFPKLVATNPALHKLYHAKGWLLDHEVELGIVFGNEICSAENLENQLIGFLVVNDFTDRATLMRKMDSRNVSGGKGFPDAKSKEGFLPTGPYLVIPKNWKTFVGELRLELSVNGALRQSGDAKDMAWDIAEIVRQSLLAKGQKNGYYKSARVPLFEGNCIAQNSIILTGTPAGVVFKAPQKSFVFNQVLRFIFTGRFLGSGLHPFILRQYLKKERENPRYLKPGDVVETRIRFLGTIRTEISG